MDRLTDGWLRLKTIAIPSSPMIVLLKSIAIPLLTPMVMFEPFIQWQWFLIFLLKKYISGQGLFPYMLEYTYIHRPISKTKQAKKVKTLSNEHRILKGTNCRNVVLVVQREKSLPKRKSAPGVSDHQGNGDDEAADHHEMDVKSKDHDEDDSA